MEKKGIFSTPSEFNWKDNFWISFVQIVSTLHYFCCQLYLIFYLFFLIKRKSSETKKKLNQRTSNFYVCFILFLSIKIPSPLKPTTLSILLLFLRFTYLQNKREQKKKLWETLLRVKTVHFYLKSIKRFKSLLGKKNIYWNKLVEIVKLDLKQASVHKNHQKPTPLTLFPKTYDISWF